MEDNQIINLYFDRSEQAIKETDTKYGGYCYSIAYNILTNQEDAEESVSDTYLSAWNSMPPRRPPALAAFLGKITRNISIDRWRKYRAFKRGEGQIEIALDELSECVGGESAEDAAIRKEILASLKRFLGTLKETERSVFLCRYCCLRSHAAVPGENAVSAFPAYGEGAAQQMPDAPFQRIILRAMVDGQVDADLGNLHITHDAIPGEIELAVIVCRCCHRWCRKRRYSSGK